MAKPGRKRKPGPRTAGDRAQRAIKPFDNGCDGVIRRRAAFGEHAGDSHDAIGRAYASGLLGNGERAKDYRDAARKISRQYWRVYGCDFATMTPLARFVPGNGSGYRDEVAELIREQALNDALAAIEKLGREVRHAFDDLVIDINPDDGPSWLDRLIAGLVSHGDRERLAAALRALETVA